MSRLVGLLNGDRTDVLNAIKDVVDNARSEGSRHRMTLKYSAATTQKHASLCWHVVQGVADLVGCNPAAQAEAFMTMAEFLRMGRIGNPAQAIEVIRDVAFDSVFEFLDEQLDGRNAIYGLLLKYKQRSEWYWRGRLRGFARDGLEKVTGEKALAVDLYDYILGQGVDFSVEPSISSGKPDLVIRESEGRHLVIDAKYIATDAPPSKVKKTLADGFHQVHRYCTDFSEPSGFLVVFSETRRRLSLPLSYQDGFPAIQLGPTTVYYMEVSIADEPSASKSGKADEIVIEPDDLKLSDFAGSREADR